MAFLKSIKNFGVTGKHSKPKLNQAKGGLTVIQNAEEGKTPLCVARSKNTHCGQPGSEVPTYGMMTLVGRHGCEDRC